MEEIELMSPKVHVLRRILDDEDYWCENNNEGGGVAQIIRDIIKNRGGEMSVVSNVVTRVCGELAVSRSIGDKDFKRPKEGGGGGNDSSADWDGPQFLPYPTGHPMKFGPGDLVSGECEISKFVVPKDAFLVIGCDGVWDVLNSKEVGMISRGVMDGNGNGNGNGNGGVKAEAEEEGGAGAKAEAEAEAGCIVGNGGTMKTARTIVRLSGGLGSSDNCTVICLRM